MCATTGCTSREPQSCESPRIVSFNAHRHIVDSAHPVTVKPPSNSPNQYIYHHCLHGKSSQSTHVLAFSTYSHYPIAMSLEMATLSTEGAEHPIRHPLGPDELLALSQACPARHSHLQIPTLCGEFPTLTLLSDPKPSSSPSHSHAEPPTLTSEPLPSRMNSQL